ncbi:MAG TPA: M48 family metallopeptidase [Myxococcota bacterium]|nr:M48 family metallopeptidase [Myxococcota bacterium]
MTPLRPAIELPESHPTPPRSGAARGALVASAVIAALLGALIAACETSSLGRRQFKLLSDSEMNEMGVAAFAQISKQTPASQDAGTNAKVACVANAVTRNASGPNASASWEVRVFADDSANAFALPGGKIGVNTGLLKVARTQGQLAAVIGHEVAHVLEGHANERVSSEAAGSLALGVLSTAAGAASPAGAQMINLLGGPALQVGVLLPYGRQHESEADLVGLDLMAKSGFDPNEAIALWENMSKAASGAQPPEFLSTHPSHGTRIYALRERIPIAMPLYESARASGRIPRCY